MYLYVYDMLLKFAVIYCTYKRKYAQRRKKISYYKQYTIKPNFLNHWTKVISQHEGILPNLTPLFLLALVSPLFNQLILRGHVRKWLNRCMDTFTMKQIFFYTKAVERRWTCTRTKTSSYNVTVDYLVNHLGHYECD